MTVDTEKYLEFVEGVTSPPESRLSSSVGATVATEANGTNVTQLLTAALGLTAESGEFTEVVKKIFLQGNPTLKRMSFI